MSTTTNIEFDNIPSSLRKPGVYTEYNSKNAVSTLPTNEQNVLIVAPMILDSDSGAPFTDVIPIYSDDDAKKAFGAGSWAHLMCRVAIQNNTMIRLSAIGLRDSDSGVKAEASITGSGNATSQGVFKLTMGGEDYSVSIASGETARAVMDRLSAVINASELSPAKAEVSSEGITLTAKCAGAIGNEISVKSACTAQGVQISVRAFEGGAENADLTDALASVAGEHYHVIISPFADHNNAQALRAHLELVASPMEKKPAIGVLGFKGTLAQGTTFAGQINSNRITVAWYKGCNESVALLSAAYGSVIAKEEDPARPLNTLALKGLTLIDETKMPLKTEINQALFHGLTPIVVVNYRVQIERAITTYTKNPANVDDPAWLDLTTIRTLDYVRKSVEQRISLRFPRAKLSNRTPAKVRSEILDVLYRLEDMEMIENVDANKAKLLVVRNPQDPNRLDTAIPSDVVNGLHVVANRIDLIL